MNFDEGPELVDNEIRWFMSTNHFSGGSRRKLRARPKHGCACSKLFVRPVFRADDSFGDANKLHSQGLRMPRRNRKTVHLRSCEERKPTQISGETTYPFVQVVHPGPRNPRSVPAAVTFHFLPLGVGGQGGVSETIYPLQEKGVQTKATIKGNLIHELLPRHISARDSNNLLKIRVRFNRNRSSCWQSCARRNPFPVPCVAFSLVWTCLHLSGPMCARVALFVRSFR